MVHKRRTPAGPLNRQGSLDDQCRRIVVDLEVAFHVQEVASDIAKGWRVGPTKYLSSRVDSEAKRGGVRDRLHILRVWRQYCPSPNRRLR